MCKKHRKPGKKFYLYIIVSCLNCQTQSSSCMCFNCFINGDHRGHKFSIRESGGGVCDCGDPDGLKPSGYCKDHHGHSQLDESISSKDIQFFKERIMKLWIPILYYSSFKKNVNISQNKHQDILEAWDLLWK